MKKLILVGVLVMGVLGSDIKILADEIPIKSKGNLEGFIDFMKIFNIKIYIILTYDCHNYVFNIFCNYSCHLLF